MDLTQITEYVEPELLILVPVLYILGMIIKHTEAIDNKYIPVILGIVGIILCAFYVCATGDLSTGSGIVLAIFTSIVQGLLVAGMAVYVNQLIKQGTTKG